MMPSAPLSKELGEAKYVGLAQLLLMHETNAKVHAASDLPAVADVCEKLWRVFSLLVGVDGFKALLMRALALSVREAPDLKDVNVTPAGTIEGFGRGSRAGGESLIVNLLSLTARFIGEPLTMRLVADAWPELAVLDGRFIGKEQSE